MLLSDFIKVLKRKTRYGEVDVIDDQVTSDIIHYINNRRFDVWGRYPWHWAIEEFTINTTSGVSDYYIDSVIGDIIVIARPNNEGFLKKITLKRYLSLYNKFNNVVTSDQSIKNYVYMGLHPTTQAIKIRLLGTPNSSISLTGFGKKRISRFTVSDIPTASIDYFPDEFLNVVEEGVIADIYESKGEMNEYLAKEKLYNNSIIELIRKYNLDEDTEEIDTLSDYFRFNSSRGSGTRVT